MFRAVGNRCAFDPSCLRLTRTDVDPPSMLRALGFQFLTVDLIQLARSRVGVSRYSRGARLALAPEVLDCSSFMKWLFAQRGILLPRRTIQQIQLGVAVELEQLAAGDLVYITGSINWHEEDPTQGVGHVGIATGEGTVIHAANSKVGIVESPFAKFLGKEQLRGIRRHIPQGRGIFTLQTPPYLEVETSDDIRWILLRNLPPLEAP